MSLVILHADRLRRATGACVLIVHHTGSLMRRINPLVRRAGVGRQGGLTAAPTPRRAEACREPNPPCQAPYPARTTYLR
jgi:hypothetical protein